MASELWTGLTLDNANNIRKWLYGSVLVRDWKADGSTALNSFSPFDPATGNLVTTLLSPSNPGGQWYELGSMSEDGVSFTPKFTTEDTKIWQSRHPQRTDVTEDAEEVMFTMAESTPLADYLRNNLPLSGGVPEIGTTGYTVVQPLQTDIIYRQLCIIGVDGQATDADYICELRPRVSLTKKGKRDFQAKKMDGTELTFGVYPDPASGFAAATLRGGPLWGQQGGTIQWPTPQVAPVATAVTGLKATITFAQPVSLNDPWTYTVTKITGGTPSAATIVGSPTVSNGTVTITVGGLTASTPYTFTVTAVGSNGATGTTVVSNSITSTAS